MKLARISLPSNRLLASAMLVALSLVLSVYGPMVTYTQAQAVEAGKVQELKDKALGELNRRISNYKKTLESLEVDAKVDKSGAKTSGSGEDLGKFDFKLGKNGFEGSVALADGIKDKTKQFLQKIIESLTAMVSKVKEASSLADVQSLTKNIDAQFNLDQLTQVQAAVTQAVDSMTGVLDSLKNSFNGVQSRVTQMKDCVSGLKSGDTSANVSASKNGVKADCGSLTLDSAETAKNAQGQLDSLSSITTTIASILASAVTLIMSLMTSFTGLAGGLGGLGSLGNLGNLSSMLSGGGLSNLTGSLGSITGLLGSFSAISSQLDLANGMSGNAFNSLSSLTGLLNF